MTGSTLAVVAPPWEQFLGELFARSYRLWNLRLDHRRTRCATSDGQESRSQSLNVTVTYRGRECMQTPRAEGYQSLSSQKILHPVRSNATTFSVTSPTCSRDRPVGSDGPDNTASPCTYTRPAPVHRGFGMTICCDVDDRCVRPRFSSLSSELACGVSFDPSFSPDTIQLSNIYYCWRACNKRIGISTDVKYRKKNDIHGIVSLKSQLSTEILIADVALQSIA